MLRQTEDANVPLSLTLAIRDRHRGLVAVELGQMKGQRSYTTIGDGRWTMQADGGSAPGHDDEPHTPPERIAREVWQAAVDWRGQHGGDSRFQAKLWVIDKKGETAAHAVTFTVDEGAVVNTEDVIEARSRASFMSEMTSYTALCHTRLMASYKELGALAKNIEGLMRVPLTILEHAIDLRMEALEDRIEALVDGGDEAPRRRRSGSDDAKLEGWKQAAEQFKEVANGPLGRAAMLKLLGVEGAEAMKMLGLPTGADEKPTIRGTLIELGTTLTLVQRERLKSELGPKVNTQLLFDAATADDEHAAATRCIDFFEALESQGLINVPDTILTEAQGKLLARVMGLCEEHVKAAEAAAEREQP